MLNFILHISEHLAAFVSHYGVWAYVIMFAIIFLETGLVVTPFLPGDSLLFAAGAVAATGVLNIHLFVPLLIIAALLGDNMNYWIGRLMGPRLFKNKNSKIFNRKYLDKTHAFYEKYGGKTVIIARFVPIVRTFSPFVAGIGAMTYRRFMLFSVIAAVVWVTSLSYLSFWFGRISVIRHNFLYVILAIIVLSLIPPAFEFFKHRKQSKLIS